MVTENKLKTRLQVCNIILSKYDFQLKDNIQFLFFFFFFFTYTDFLKVVWRKWLFTAAHNNHDQYMMS